MDICNLPDKNYKNCCSKEAQWLKENTEKLNQNEKNNIRKK